MSGRYLIQDGCHRAYKAYLDKKDTVICKILPPEKADPVHFEIGYLAMKRGVRHVKNMLAVSDKEYGRLLPYESEDVPLEKFK